MNNIGPVTITTSGNRQIVISRLFMRRARSSSRPGPRPNMSHVGGTGAVRRSPFATLVFTEEGNQTRLTMTIECATRQERDALLQMRVDDGTAQTLENLAAYLPATA